MKIPFHVPIIPLKLYSLCVCHLAHVNQAQFFNCFFQIHKIKSSSPDNRILSSVSLFPVEFTASRPNEGSPPSGRVNISVPQGPRGVPAFAPDPSRHFQWVIESMRVSKAGPHGKMAYVGKHPSWGPMEAKAGPLEVMTLPTSLRQDNQENYSGEGRDKDVEEATPPSAGRTVSEEEREMEGSGEGSRFPGGFGVKVNNMSSGGVKPSLETESSLSQSELVTVSELTTLSQWQLVDQPTTSPHSQKTDTAEEAIGGVFYVRRPTENLSSASSHRGKDTSNSGFNPVFRKNSKDKSREELDRSRAEALMEVLTTSAVTTPELLMARHTQRTDPTTTDNPSHSSPTEEPSISISWVQEDKTGTPNIQEARATPAPSMGSQTTTGVLQFTTLASDSRVGATEMESRSAVSDSFIVGSRWTPFKGVGQKSEEHKAKETTDKKDRNNPFGILIPNWAFGLIPSGTWAPRCSRWMNLTVIIIVMIMSNYLISSDLLNYLCSSVTYGTVTAVVHGCITSTWVHSLCSVIL